MTLTYQSALLYYNFNLTIQSVYFYKKTVCAVLVHPLRVPSHSILLVPAGAMPRLELKKAENPKLPLAPAGVALHVSQAISQLSIDLFSGAVGDVSNCMTVG